jgi:hypothetical protein
MIFIKDRGKLVRSRDLRIDNKEVAKVAPLTLEREARIQRLRRFHAKEQRRLRREAS